MSTSRVLIAATLSKAAVRRRRKSDGALFAVAKLTDRDRLDPRCWTAFANDLEIIDRLEALRVGEPLACVGPFAAAPSADGGTVQWRITIEELLDTKRKPKGKKLIAKEERVRSDEWDGAPTASEAEGRPFDDKLPW